MRKLDDSSMYCFSSTFVSYSVSFYLENNITALYMIFLHIPFLCNILTSVSVHVFLTYHTFCNILPLHHYMFFLHIAFLQHTYLYINTCSSYIHFCNILTSILVYVFPTLQLFFQHTISISLHGFPTNCIFATYLPL